MSYPEPEPTSEDMSDAFHESTLPTRVVLGDLERPLAEIVPWEPDMIPSGSAVALDAEQRSAMSALLSQVPALMQSAQGVVGQTYRLTFAPEVAEKMVSTMKGPGNAIRAVALGPDGKIVGQGVLHPANGVKALSAATAVWQGLAIVTAQVHLSEINSRLAKIEQGIDTIKALLEAEQISKLTTGLRYVQSAVSVLARGDVDEGERRQMAAQVEQIWQECGQVAHTCLQLLERAPQEFEQLPLNAWYQLDESVALAHEAITSYERRASAYLFATQVRCATVALREGLGLSRDMSEYRQRELRHDLQTWRDQHDRFSKTVSHGVQEGIGAMFRTSSTIEQGRMELKLYALTSGLRLDQQSEGAWRSIALLGDQIDQMRQPLTLLVTLDEQGQLADAFQVK